MLLALCRCKASKPADIVFYFKGFATKQMCKDKSKQPQIWVCVIIKRNTVTTRNSCFYLTFIKIAVNNAG